ncbi:MAG: 5'/3'-nucleotidase SurE [Muribaculaceae bacterium]|nr:5'/3'-nucleotidase SurE [Muribaculaceae bacterium]
MASNKESKKAQNKNSDNSTAQQPLILVSNDDGYQAPGVKCLVEYLQRFGHVICVCPDAARSGQSMALTVNSPLRLTRLPDLGESEMYCTNGTPVDCVKLAMHTVCRDRRPDILISGINHGSNASVNVMYSGTMGAAFEGCACGIPSVGFSLTSHSMQADFAPSLPYVDFIVRRILTNGLPEGICLNVNIPADCVPTEMRLVRAARSHWSDEYADYTDPHGQPFYWLTGQLINLEPEATDTDLYVLEHKIVSVVPCMLDRTADITSHSWLQDLDGVRP